ncbi:hypothetical protein B5X24_HaOG204549 [Helicoverpa armigera]|uniref:RRM domain-containing protein n=1 Tax=Helicoverpa armigera TaxID=29058 RepID=A0A2W1BNC8_HELAM|nr:hypothetical protein B5X24_HaOG204549 [Helicoverpa armigera]
MDRRRIARVQSAQTLVPVVKKAHFAPIWKFKHVVWTSPCGVTVDIEVAYEEHLSEDVPPVQRSAPLLQSPQYTGGRPQPYNASTNAQASTRSCCEDTSSQHSQHSCEHSQNDMDYGSGGPPPPGMMKDRHGPPPPHHPRDGRGYGPEGYGGEGFVPPPPMHHPSMPPQNQGGPPQQGAVMMVYGLDPQTVNADRLFNLCCLYGNVVRIKFLKTKEGTAMVQMGDGVSVERCVQNLNNVLHFFNTPPDVSDEQLLQVFKDYGVTPPHTISKFPLKSERSSSGLMEFQNISQSVMAIMACNHATIQHPGAKFPFVMKLCFSSSRQIGQGKGQNPNKSQNQNQDQNNQRQGQNNGMAEHEY